MLKHIRRLVTFTAAAAIAALPAPIFAQPKEVKVAVAVPTSGPWARNGELHVKGAQQAVEDINAQGVAGDEEAAVRPVSAACGAANAVRGNAFRRRAADGRRRARPRIAAETADAG